jgi:hypothetical protein
VTHLRQIVLEELERRNYSESTVEHYSRHFHLSLAKTSSAMKNGAFSVVKA